MSGILLVGFVALVKVHLALQKEHVDMIKELQTLRIEDLKTSIKDFEKISDDQIKALDRLSQAIRR